MHDIYCNCIKYPLVIKDWQLKILPICMGFGKIIMFQLESSFSD